MCVNCQQRSGWNPTSPPGRRTTAEMDQGAAEAMANGVTGRDLSVSFSVVFSLAHAFAAMPAILTREQVVHHLATLATSYRELEAAVLRVEGQQILEHADHVAAHIAAYVADEDQ